MKYYLAIDLGASSGRHILGWLEDGKMKIKEIYRFANGPLIENGKWYWDDQTIFFHVTEGLKACKELGIIPESIAVDTWGLDYVLLDEEDLPLERPYNYRDARTKGIYEEIFRYVPREELYEITGLQMAEFNTICQLMADKRDNPEKLQKAKNFLMMPDYLNFLLTGEKRQEYSNATTTQLINAGKPEWKYDLIERLGLPVSVFGEVSMPGQIVAPLKPEISQAVGFQTKVALVPTHDTASALMAIGTEEPDTMLISSGTWSLVGMEMKDSICTRESLDRAFTNEGGYEGTVDYLKNSMGLWMIQCVQKEMAPDMNFAELCKLAERECIDSVVDANDARFLGPENMCQEIIAALTESGLRLPQTLGEMAKVVYHSLAVSYDKIAKELEEIRGVPIRNINILGGGSKADYLNRLTRDITGKRIYAGPAEATALGNLMCQMIMDGAIADQNEGRRIVQRSFDVKIYD